MNIEKKDIERIGEKSVREAKDRLSAIDVEERLKEQRKARWSKVSRIFVAIALLYIFISRVYDCFESYSTIHRSLIIIEEISKKQFAYVEDKKENQFMIDTLAFQKQNSYSQIRSCLFSLAGDCVIVGVGIGIIVCSAWVLFDNRNKRT